MIQMVTLLLFFVGGGVSVQDYLINNLLSQRSTLCLIGQFRLKVYLMPRKKSSTYMGNDVPRMNMILLRCIFKFKLIRRIPK